MKGRLDDKDKEKARRGSRWCELLTENDSEPWHYLMLVENPALNRQDITWWQSLGTRTIEDLLRHHEGLPLIPGTDGPSSGVRQVLPSVGADEQYQAALPVFDLSVMAGQFGSDVAPTVTGWVKVARRPLDQTMFVAKVVGRSMEPGIPNGAWGLFRSFPVGDEPAATQLDGRRVVARLASRSDPETGAYTLKRWKVTKVGAENEPLEISLGPDNRDLKPIVVTPAEGELRVVAEFLEMVG